MKQLVIAEMEGLCQQRRKSSRREHASLGTSGSWQMVQDTGSSQWRFTEMERSEEVNVQTEGPQKHSSAASLTFGWWTVLSKVGGRLAVQAAPP